MAPDLKRRRSQTHSRNATGRAGTPESILSVRTIALIIFFLVLALTGGSSRIDNPWLLLLRPVTVICLMAILLATPRISWSAVRPLPVLLAAFAATVAIQLVPLPPVIWLNIPGRAPFNAVAEALNGTTLWHPLALSPDRAWNSLIALLVPFTAMVGFVSLNEQLRRAMLWAVLGLILFSMMLGLVQFAGGKQSLLYWYPVSGRGQLLGLLANRNHQGAMLALALPLLRAWMLMPVRKGQNSKLPVIIGLSIAALIVIYALVLGSRAGMALTVVGLIAAYLVEPSLKVGNQRLTKQQRYLILGGVILAVAGLLVLALNADRAIAVARLLNNENMMETEGRFTSMPTLLHIVRETFPFGTGFGSFIPVYQSFEPDALLKPTYLNNAHNDLIELAITGGLPALLVFFAFLVWYGMAAYRAFTKPSSSTSLARAAAFAILILLLASIVDYPLRTPLLGALFTIFCCWLAQISGRERKADDAN